MANNLREKVLVLDFGGQYNQLIARRVRDAGVYSELKSCRTKLSDIKQEGYKGIIFTGGPASAYLETSPTCDSGIFSLGVPILGICYGAQLMAHKLGGRVSSVGREYGSTEVTVNPQSPLFLGLAPVQTCWMSHTDYIERLPEGFSFSAASAHCPCAAMENKNLKFYAVQFHPEVMHTEHGDEILKNFLYNICGCAGDWKMSSFVTDTVKKVRDEIGEGRALCALSGGVDSSVAAVMLAKAIGEKLTCIFVDHGMLRKGEGDMVESTFKDKFGLKFIRVNAEKRFLSKLSGVTEPEKKRKIIGEEFIRVFEDEAQKIGEVDYLVQGTIYPDVIESGGSDAATIKSHHNVGGLPERMHLKLCEPLRDLFKDEVRRAGLELGLPPELVYRQPFPGPGLAVRCIGEVTEQRLAILSEADAIFREEIAKAGLDRDINQYFAVITDMHSVGVMGDCRTYDCTVALRAVKTIDFMTADWARIPYDVLAIASSRIVNEVRGVNRVVYDITTKPPATIEWE
jgi:GMP synthase (glutamine-hydrolysing)